MDLLYFYQHLPEHIDSIAFAIGNFKIYWYSLMYIVGFLVVYLLLKNRIDDESLILDFLIYSFIGLIIGARLGYFLFYDFGHFKISPLAIFSPFDSDGKFVGISGMSYHGGLIGVIISSIIFSKSHKIGFFQWADFIIPAIPAGYFFGRLGNFLNGELYGKVTGCFWGMYFKVDSSGVLRHPTQLYEAFLEGILIFLILWPLRNKAKFPGQLLVLYLFSYGVIRFFVEFFREQERALTRGLTVGQWLSFLMILASIFMFFWLKKKEIRKEKQNAF